MLTFKARVMVTFFVLVDVSVTALAWLLAYLVRFETGLIPVTKGMPSFDRYLLLLPLMSALLPAIMYFHGLYQLKRGRSRIDEFFAIVFSVCIASGLTLSVTLYIRVYHRFQPAVAPAWEYSQAVFALFIGLGVLLLNLGRWSLRSYLEHMWAAGYNLKRVVVAGAGELGQLVAGALINHHELGYRVAGFIDDDPGRPMPAGAPPVLGTLDDVLEVTSRHHADQLYIALPLEDHAKLLRLIKAASNECLDLKVVPDLVQYAAIQAALEDLDGIPIISLNEVPLRGWNSMVKRLMDVTLGGLLLGVLSVVMPILPVVALLIKLRGGPGPVFYRQERMSVDGKTFLMYKFRSMHAEAEKDTGPVWAAHDDPRRTPIGVWLRRFNLDELPQLINVVLGDMSLVGPRPERPSFVSEFKNRIPGYMLRHRVKSGITGWAQVNGWRGNTSLEKRIEYDLHYIENWSLLLDMKILIMTIFRGFGQKHAY